MAVAIGPVGDEERKLCTVREAYERRVGNPEEPTYRKRLASLYCDLVPEDQDRLMTRPQREALERCAEGLPYEIDDSWATD
jgi:hypothetical protein